MAGNYREIAEEFCRIWVVNARKMEKIEKSLSAKGEAKLLLFLAQADRELLAGELSKKSGLSFSRVTNILNSLEKKSLIQKRTDDADKRKVYIALTAAGKTYILKKHEEVVEQYEKVFQQGGWEDSLEYLRLIKKFSALMNEEIDLKMSEDLKQQ